MAWRWFLLASLAMLPGAPAGAEPVEEAGSGYFEGRWAFLNEDCRSPASWTMISGGHFVSENLVGKWSWQDSQLILNLDDLAIDDETGEPGGRFRMDGPVRIIGPDRFDFTIAPEVYHLKRCEDK